jgi:Mg2+ and Co2+ transporter CorA
LTEEFGMDFEEKKELERAVGQAMERLKQGREGEEKEKVETLKKEKEVVTEAFKQHRDEKK